MKRREETLVPGHKGMPMRKMTPARLVALLQLLESGPALARDLAQGIDVAESVLRPWLRALRAARYIYVAEWESERVGLRPLWRPAFSWGSKSDKKRPAKLSGAERCRQYKARKRARELQQAIDHALGGGA